MTGGSIQNNSAQFGGGVCLTSATFVMSGGTITNNEAVHGGGETGYGCGGGICIIDNADINLSGGTISGNTAAEWGGGISVGYPYASDFPISLTMTGGTISDNTAGSGGGGILIQAGYTTTAGTATISGGSIINNKMTGTGVGDKAFGGGGIYVNGFVKEYAAYGLKNATLHLTNAIITNNTAEEEGGGYAACPSSDTKIYVRNGAAIIGNTGSSARDLFILGSNAYGSHNGDPAYEVSPIMLGGTPYNWKYEDNTEVPLNELKGILHAANNEDLSLHTDVTDDDAATNAAKVFITGNTSATKSAGIGSNGTVEIGTSSETTSINVTKTWVDDDAANRPDAVQINLYCKVKGSTEEPVYVGQETMKADDNGNWTLSFDNLPKTDPSGNEYEYSVKEAAVAGYAAVISGNQEDGFTVANSPEKTRNVTVTKKWSGGKKAAVTIHLLADGAETASQELSEANNWTYTFEGLPEEKDGKTITYTITEDPVSGYKSTITGDADTGFTVTNKKKPSGGSSSEPSSPSTRVTLSANKVLTGKDLATGEFTFQLTGKDKDGKALSLTAANDANGNITFSPITFTKEGDYTYIIKEISGTEKDMTYDPSEKTVTVHIEKVAGSLRATVDYGSTGKAEFTNTYLPNKPVTPVEISVNAKKVLAGKALQNGEFNFQLTGQDENGNPLTLAAKNDANGNITFAPISFTKAGRYTFELREMKGSEENITYDDSFKTVTVTVTETDGVLSAKMNANDNAVTFTNTYEPPKAPGKTDTPKTPVTETKVTKNTGSTFTPNTGDTNQPMLWMFMAALSAAALSILARRRRTH